MIHATVPAAPARPFRTLARLFLPVLLFFLSASGGAALNTMVETTFGYSSNIFSDYSETADFVNRFRLTLSDRTFSPGSVSWWKISAGADTFFGNNTENNYPASIYYKHRKKFASSVLDFDADVYYDAYPRFSTGRVVDNTAYSHLAGTGRMIWRRDFSSSSLYLGYSLQGLFFPDYDLDRTGHVLSCKFSIDPAILTTVVLQGRAGYNRYTERFVMDGSGNGTGDAFHDLYMDAGLLFRHFFNADTGFEAGAKAGFLRSNGNFYFYGPFETALIPDGDEQLLPDFFSYDFWSGSLTFRQRLGMAGLKLSGTYLYRSYTARPAFDAGDSPIAGSVEYDHVWTFDAEITLRFTSSFRVVLSGKYEIRNSNNYKQDTTVLATGAGVRYQF